ncbi:DUF1761 domain-containing protein [Candidatus Campbellbacteria bacterium]|nr:MAG: DUF1761 domain-containing protein [Candidatus Campbellbacteria bacterium]
MYINFLAVFLAGGVSLFLAWAWYSNFLFGRQWRALSGLPDEYHQQMATDKKMMAQTMLIYFVGLVLMAGVLARVLFYMGAYGVMDGITTAFWMWIGFVAPCMLGMKLWERKTWAYYFINVGYVLLALVVSGVILMLWH